MSRTARHPAAPLRRALVGCAATVLVASGVWAAAPAATAATAPAAAAPVRLGGSVFTVPDGATLLGPAATAARLTVDVALHPRDPAALSAFVAAVSTPGSPRYHDYLPAGRLDATFGPTAATVAATRRWLASTGLAVGPTSPDGLLVPVTGTTAQVEGAFDDPLVEARLPSGRRARVATRDPLVPAALAPALAGVIGLGNQSAPAPQLVRAAHLATVPGGSASSPDGSPGPQACSDISEFTDAWTATGLASAYGLSTLYGNDRVGAGQTVGIYELEPFTPSDIAAYQACYGTSVPVSTVPVDGGATGVQSGEAALDIEVVAGLAPGASIRVYSGPDNNGDGPIDTYAAMVDQDAAKVLTTSWGQCESLMDPGDQETESDLFAMAAAQGQSVFAASGDSGSSDCFSSQTPSLTQLAVDDPADQPDVTGVGGTSLVPVSGAAPVETAWSPDPGASGGGNSVDFVAPYWQQVPAARSADTSYGCGTPPDDDQQCREVPDVAASADPEHGDIVYWSGGWWTFGGTSQAAPLWAALVADTDQGCATSAGLLGPVLYASGSADAFNDITSGTNAMFGGTEFTAGSGYDLVTGWGSPRAASLLGLLSGAAAGCPAVTGLSPSSGYASGGTTVTISGSGFGTGTPTVDFGGVAAQVTASTPTSITVRTPDVTYGTTSGVTVTTTGPAAGTSAAVPAARYTFVSPTVTAVLPDKGPTAGGVRVTVEGTGFTGSCQVTAGTASPPSEITSDTSLTTVVPPGPSGGGSVSIAVTCASGTSPGGPATLYRYSLPGYLLAASDGGVFTYGAASFHGSAGGLALVDPVVGTAMAPGDDGYWLVASDGGVFAYGDAGFYGSTGDQVLNDPIVGMAATPDGRGYWLVASDGGVFAFGDAGFYGSTGDLVLNDPIVGMAATPDGRGYWLVASDGGVFAFGDAGFYGSTGDLTLHRPVVGMAATPDGRGYWLVASDGGIFAYGDASFHGSTGGLTLNRPVVGMAVDLTGGGYWLVASDGGIFAFGDAGFYGSAGGVALDRPVVAMAST